MVGCYRLLSANETLEDVTILCPYNCPHRSGHSVPVNLRQEAEPRERAVRFIAGSG